MLQLGTINWSVVRVLYMLEWYWLVCFYYNFSFIPTLPFSLCNIQHDYYIPVNL